MKSIKRIAFFRGVDDADLNVFERRCGWRNVETGHTIVDFDEQTSEVYFLVSGEVRVQIRTSGGKEMILADLRDGEFFGELSAIDGIPRSANVTALTRSLICVVGAATLHEMLAVSPVLSRKMMQRLAGHVRELNTRLLERTVLDVRHGLYAELLRISTPRPQAAPARIVSPPPYHHVLAARVGCRREQVTRELGAMEREGLIIKARGSFVLPQPDKLRAKIASRMAQAE